MKVLDFLGNELEVGSVVTVKLDHVIGVVQKVDTGEIAQGILTGDGKPAGQVLPPHVIIQIQATQAMLIQAPPGSPVGQVPSVVKIAKPEAGK